MLKQIAKYSTLIVLLFIFTACGSGGGSGTTAETKRDTDGDGLSDVDETSIHHTSPQLADTDGDGFSDFDEIKQLGFDPSVNNFKFNPLVADQYMLDISIQKVPIIGYIFTNSSGSSQNTSTTRGSEQGVSQSNSVGGSVTVGVEATVGAEVSGSISGPSASVSASLSVSASSTVSFDNTSTTQNKNSWSDMQGSGVEQSSETTGGYLRTTVVLKNIGHVPFEITHFSLSATKGNKNVPSTSLATLEFSAFQATTLKKDGSSGPLEFSDESLNLDTVRTLLNEARSITLEPALFKVVDDTGKSFDFRDTQVSSRTAKVLIDYGTHKPVVGLDNVDRNVELYKVATNSDPDNPGQTLATLLSGTHLAIPHVVSAGGIQSIRGIGTAPGRWVVNTVRHSGTSVDQKLYGVKMEPFSLANITIKAGDEVSIVYLEDPDGDGLGFREETLNGTNPNLADTDGDGINDFDEIRIPWTVNATNILDPNRYPVEVYSSPVDADYDGDKLNDSQERDKGLDPYNKDTDGDGIQDDIDTDNGAKPIVVTLKVTPEMPLKVTVEGSLTAAENRVVATASIDWGDGSAPEIYGTNSGGSNTIRVTPVRHIYATAGDYTVTLQASDDATPAANTVMQTSTVKFTEAARIDNALGYNQAWRLGKHIREVVDVNNDGFDDIVGFGNEGVYVALGSASGFSGNTFDTAFTQWSTEWGKEQGYPSVVAYPRLLVDINSDQKLDIVGVNDKGEIRYSLNNGSGFDAPVSWVSVTGWNSVRDNLFMIDVNKSGRPDIVHASTARGLVVYINQSNALNLSVAITDAIWPPDANSAIYPDKRIYPIEAADLDDDKCTDLVLFGLSDTYYRHSLCDGTGRFASWSVLRDKKPALGHNAGWRIELHKRFVTDINNDNKPDIVGFSGTNVLAFLNKSTPGNVSFASPRQWSTEWANNKGWRDSDINGNNRGIFPRYLADVNGDGYKDVVGYGINGLRVGLNRLGFQGSEKIAEFVPEIFWSASYDMQGSNKLQWSEGIREYFPRMVGDLNGDGKADFIGFDRNGIVYQYALEGTPFQTTVTP